MSQTATETATTTHTDTAITTPAEAAPAATPAQAAAVDPRDDLRAAIAEHKAALRMKDEPVAQAPAEGDKPTETATLAEVKEEPKTDAQAAQEAQGTPAAPAETDSPPDVIARYLRQERAARAAKKQAEEAAAASKAEQEAARVAKETAEKARQTTDELMALAKSNPKEAVRKLLGDSTLRDSSVLYDLMTGLDEKGEAPKQTEEERVVALVSREIEIRKAAEQKVEEEARVQAEQKRQAENKQNREIYFTGLAEEFKANSTKYPFLAAGGMKISEIDTWIGEQFAATHVLPTPDAIFTHFDGVQKKVAEKLAAALHKTGGPTPPATPQSGQKPSPNAALKVGVDSRGKPPVKTGEHKSFRDEREEIMQRLDRTRA